MPTMINLGKDISCKRGQKPSSLGLCRVQPKSDDSQMIRICPNDSKKLEYSTNQGRSWILRYPGNNNFGNFQDLMDEGKELLGTTDKGLFYSTNQGRSWILRKRN